MNQHIPVFNANSSSIDFQQVAVGTDELRTVLQYSYSAFIKLFLYDQEGIEKGVPDFHEWVMSLMNSSAYEAIAIAIPRDHAKTTLAKLTAVHHFIYTAHRFLIYVSNTSTIAVNAVRDIANFIRSPLCKSVYGEAVFTEAKEAVGNYTLHWCNKIIIIRALGAGQQVRGMNVDNQRPDLAIVDDLESAEEGESNKLGYEPLKKWFYGTFAKAMDRRKSKIIQIGNLVSTKSILNDHLKSPYWKSVCMAVITEDGHTLWPARWTITQLRMELLRYIQEGQLYTWLAEMMNMPTTQANKILDPNNLAITVPADPGDESLILRCITVDPAITDNMGHAHAAVVCVHVFNGAYWQLAEKRSQYGATVYDLYNTIMELALRWKVRVVGVESVAFQTALIHVCEHEAASAGYRHMEFVPVKTYQKAKSDRILAWVAMIKRGMYRFSINDYDLLQQIQEYDLNSKKNKDDEIDCCAYVVQMISLYLDRIADIMKPEEEQAVAHIPTVHNH